MDRAILQLLERTRSIGTWRVELAAARCTWSPATYAIHQEDPSKEIRLEAGINYYVPEHRPIIEGCIQASIENATPWDEELQIRTAKGELRWVRAIGEPIFLDGELTHLQGIFEDIDERKSLEVEREGLLKRIEDLNGRLTLAMEASQIGVWEWNVMTGELIWDPHMYRLYGLKESEFSGAYEAWESGLHPDDKQEAVDAIQRAFEEKKKFEATFRVVWPDGTVRTIQGIGETIFDSSGEPLRLIGVNWDVTELVKTQEELRRSNEELNQFAYRTSHDLKSPLTAIRRLTSYVQKDLKEGVLDEVAANVAAIGQRAKAMESMVGGILETAKADLSYAAPEPVDMEAIMVEIAESHRFLSEDMGVDLSWTIDCAEPPTLTRIRVYQILSNLIGNGIKYASPKREERFVRLSARSANDRLIVAIEDNGTGMQGVGGTVPYQMFSRFSSEVSGSGLGLYIVKKHVEALKGTIQFESSEAGTRFELDLPAALPTEFKAPQHATSP